MESGVLQMRGSGWGRGVENVGEETGESSLQGITGPDMKMLQVLLCYLRVTESTLGD